MEGPLNQYTVAWNASGSLLASGGDDGRNCGTPQQVRSSVRFVSILRAADWMMSQASHRSVGFPRDHRWRRRRDHLAAGRLGTERQIRIPDAAQLYIRTANSSPPSTATDSVQLRNAITGDPSRQPHQARGGTVQNIAFVGTSGLLAIGDQSGTILWNVQQNRTEGAVLVGLHLGVDDESASPNGTYVAIAEDYDVRVWEARDRRLVLTVPASPSTNFSALQAVIGPDGRTLAVPADSSVELWDIPGRRKFAVIQANSSVNSVAFTPNGEFLAINTATPTTRLWNLRTRQWASASMSNGTLSADSDNNNPVAVDGNTSLVASASGANDSVTLWDRASSSQIGIFDMPNSGSARVNSITSVAFSPNERYLAATSNTGDLALWDVSPDDWAADVCALAGRELTRAEWSQHIGSSEPYQRICR